MNNGNIRIDGTLRNTGHSEQWEHWNRQNIEEQGAQWRIEGTLEYTEHLGTGGTLNNGNIRIEGN